MSTLLQLYRIYILSAAIEFANIFVYCLTEIMDGSESMRSGRSERSHRSHHSHHRHHNHSTREHSDSHRHHRKHRHRNGGHDSSRLPDENRSVSIRLPTNDDTQHLTKHDQVEVQILPQVGFWNTHYLYCM